MTIGSASHAFSADLDLFFFVATCGSVRASLSRLSHRFRQRVRASVHVSLRRRDVRVTGEYLQFMHRDAIIRETPERLVAQIVSVKVDLGERVSIRGALAARAALRLDSVRSGATASPMPT